MRPHDVPEVLILLGLIAIIAWGLYNWRLRHPHVGK